MAGLSSKSSLNNYKFYINDINGVEGSIPSSFIEKYIKFKIQDKEGRNTRTVITHSGMSVLIKEYQRRGIITIECRSCPDHITLRNELKTIINTNGNISKAFLVKAKDPYNHMTPLYVKKEDDTIYILITDSQGGANNYDPSTLYDIKSVFSELYKQNKKQIFNLVERRDFDFVREGIFAFHDILMMCQDDDLVNKLEELYKDQPYNSLSYLPEVPFKSVYLKDLPSAFSFTSEELDKTFKEYVKIIQESMRYEYHVKTTYYGSIITPRGLNMMIQMFYREGKLKTKCIALETHESLIKMLRKQSDGIRGYLVKSKDPHDHITPLYVRKNGNSYEVILSDTQGGGPHYDFTPLRDLYILQQEDNSIVEIFNVLGMRQYDNNTCPIFSIFDLVALDILSFSKEGKDAFEYFREKARYKEKIVIERYNKISFIPISLNELPPDMMILTNRYNTILEYVENLPVDINGKENRKQEFLSLIDPHIQLIQYGDKIIKSNKWAEELNVYYAAIIRSHIF